MTGPIAPSPLQFPQTIARTASEAASQADLEDGYDRLDDLEDSPSGHSPDAELGKFLAARAPGHVLALNNDMKAQVLRREMDASTHLDRLLGALGDNDLGSTNNAAPIYLQALHDLKASMPRRRLFGARPWPERMVAVALTSTRPAQLTDSLWPESPTRAGAIDRWLSRVTQFASFKLITRDRAVALMTDSGSAMPLARKALEQGGAGHAEFAAVLDGYVAAARAGVLTHGDLVRVLQSPVRQLFHTDPASQAKTRLTAQGQTMLGAVRETSSHAQDLFQAAAQACRVCEALNEREFQRVMGDTQVPMPATPKVRK